MSQGGESGAGTSPTDTTRTAAPPSVPILLPRGTLVGRFVVLEPLGGGATGTVYSAFDPTLDRQIAIKILHTRSEPEEDRVDSLATQRARVERESRAMARIKHPNVVTIYEVGVADDASVFLAMEKIDGGTLTTWLATKPSMPEILRVFGEAGEGLAAAHRSGLVHRDFKLDNVLMDTDGHPRVTDFGLARALGATTPIAQLEPRSPGSPASATSLSEPLTSSGAVVGTPGYMPPEQYGADAIDERADVFAFCAALYRGLYGVRPFLGDTVEEIAFSTLNGKLRDAPKDSNVPLWLRRVLLRGLATRREARPSSMDELLALLRDDPARRLRRGVAIAAGALVLLGGAWTVHAAGERRARACEASAARVQDLWSPARKEVIATAFKGTGTGYAATAWGQVERVLDGYAGRWNAASEAACVATRVRGEQSEPMLELRQACLDDRLVELRALLDVLATPDADVVKASAKAARALSPIEPCADIDRLTASARPPKDAGVRAEIRSLEGEIAKTKELQEAGRKRPAREVIESIRERVEQVGWGPLLVQWNLRLASLEKRSDENAAVAHYQQAIALGERFRVDDKKAAAEIALGSFEGSWLGHTETAHMWMRMADASIARLGGNALLEVERDEEEGWVYQYEHKLSEAAPLFRRVLARAREAGLDDPDTIASAHSGLSSALVAEGKWDEGVEHARIALKTMEDGYGRDHPWVPGYLNNLAVMQLDTGDTAGALASATRACAMLSDEVERGDIEGKAPDYGLAFHTLGEVQFRAGTFDAAVTSLSRARAIYLAAHGDENADVAFADNELAEAYRAVGRPADARSMLAEAARIETAVHDTPAAVRAGTLASEAQMALDHGDAREAVDLAEKALPLATDGEASAWALAETRLVLSQALRARGVESKRASELASQALGVFERLHDETHRKEAAEASELARRSE